MSWWWECVTRAGSASGDSGRTEVASRRVKEASCVAI